MLPLPVARIVAVSLPHIVRLSSDCQFTLGDRSYDLCPLLEAVSAPSSSSSSSENLYRLNWVGDRVEGYVSDTDRTADYLPLTDRLMLAQQSALPLVPVGRFVAPLSPSHDSHDNGHISGRELKEISELFVF
jgi:hypothetical protein